MAKQLALQFDDPPRCDTKISLRKEKSWPAGALSPSTVRRRAAEVAACVVVGLGRGIRLDELTVTANKRRYLRVSRRNGGWTASVHWRLLHEPQRLGAILAFALLEGRLPLDAPEWIRSLGPLEPDQTYQARAYPKGTCSPELRTRLRDVARHSVAPERANEVRIVWGRRSRRRGKRRSVRLGRLVLGDRKITIHPVLSADCVPPFVLDSVIFHEFTHWLFPPLTPEVARSRGEHRIHHSEFRAHEARYPRLHEADAWISKNLDILLCQS